MQRPGHHHSFTWEISETTKRCFYVVLVRPLPTSQSRSSNSNDDGQVLESHRRGGTGAATIPSRAVFIPPPNRFPGRTHPSPTNPVPLHTRLRCTRKKTMARRSGMALLLAAVVILDVAACGGAAVPPSCERIECPAYEVVDGANGFEIRRYKDAVWVSTARIEDISFVAATRSGFLQLFNYIQGKNAYNETIEMTAPVLTQVSPSDGPFCASSFVVSFYVPAKNQADTPPAEGLHVQRWAGARYAAVRRFGGFVADSDVGEQAALLDASLQGTRWAAPVSDGRRADPASSYTVAQYNSPFEFSGRVNEIWMLFDAKEASDM